MNNQPTSLALLAAAVRQYMRQHSDRFTPYVRLQVIKGTFTFTNLPLEFDAQSVCRAATDRMFNARTRTTCVFDTWSE